MATSQTRLATLPAKATFLRRKLYAWWEGYAFDEGAERAAVAARFGGDTAINARTADDIVAQAIWGEGRFEPGAPVWTMRFARMLNLPLKAKVVVLGAGGGAVLEDLRHGTKWKMSGFTRQAVNGQRNLKSYENASRKLHKASAAGALSFFELHRDADPGVLASFASEMLLPGGKAIFLDYTVPRRTARLRGCFPASQQEAPRTAGDFIDALKASGFALVDAHDESEAFAELITNGWSTWRSAYSAMQTLDDLKYRASLVRALGEHAQIWANRLDAIKAGQLQITKFQVLKN